MHTKGPWSYELVKDGGGELVYARIGPAGRGSIAYSGVYGPKKTNAKLSEAEADANARLVAASPSLLKALETLVEVLSRQESSVGITAEGLDEARAAIAKAKGE